MFFKDSLDYMERGLQVEAWPGKVFVHSHEAIITDK
jgi:hypothetical protein